MAAYPSLSEFIAAQPNAIQNMQAGSDYVNSIYNEAAKYQAGSQYADGDYSGAASTLARRGDIDNAQKVQATGNANNAAGLSHFAQSLTILQGIADKTASGGPQAQGQALANALDTLAPEAKQVSGISDQAIATLRQSLLTDPQGTLARLHSLIPIEDKTVGDSLLRFQGPNYLGAYTGQKETVVPNVGIYTSPAGPVPPAGDAPAMTGGPQPTLGIAAPGIRSAQSGGLYGGAVAPSSVSTVESNNDPNAVSPKGATGTMQTMPSTLSDPGFGVTPARDNSPQEQARVGTDYLAALQQHYGNPTDALIAYNMGPGATDAWIKAGANYNALPAETQQYLGRIAVAQRAGQGGSAQELTAPSQASTVQPGAPGVPQLTVKFPQAWQPLNDEQKAKYPGAIQINANGEVKYPPASQIGMSQFNPAGASQGNLHGQAYLGTLDPGIATQVKALAEGRMAFPSGFALRSPYWQGMIQAVSQYDPNFDAVNYNARAKTRNDFTSGKSAQNITSFNTAIGHLGTLSAAADALNNGNYPTVNAVENWGANAIGDPRIQQFNVAKNAVVDELTRAFRGSGGSEADVQSWAQTLDAANSPQQLHAAIQQGIELLKSRIGAVGDQYNRGMGTTADPMQMLSPQARDTIRKLDGGTPSAGSKPSAQDIVNELRRRGIVN